MIKLLIFPFRDVDVFIEKLEKTLTFFRDLENPTDLNADNDDFVPFI